MLCRCLDAILHAEHKRMLEEMRTSYMLTQRHQVEEDDDDDDDKDGTDNSSASDDVVNGKAPSGFFGITQQDGTLFLARSVGLRTLLGLIPDPDSQTR